MATARCGCGGAAVSPDGGGGDVELGIRVVGVESC
jgi:hypothetical protein